MASLKSLIVRIGADTADLEKALAGVGKQSESLQQRLKQIGNTPIGDEARKSAEALEKTIKQLTDQQQRLADRSHLAAQGINAIGGPAKLTKQQLDEMNRTIQAGIDAFRALGQEAPKDLQKVAAAIQAQQKTLQQAGSLKGGFGDLASLIPGGSLLTGGLAAGAAAGAAAFGVAAKQALAYADSLTKLSDRTGINVVGLQRLASVASASGNSIEDIAGAVNKFQRELVENSKGTQEALGRIGLSVTLLRALKPEDQFIAIAKGIQTIKDPAEQTATAMQLFGRSGAEILPSLKADVDKLANATVKMSAEAVKALDDFGDGLANLKTSAISVAGEILAAFINTAKGIEQALRDAKITPPPSDFKREIEDAIALARQKRVLAGNTLPGVDIPLSRGGAGAGVPGVPSAAEIALIERASKALLEQLEFAKKVEEAQKGLFSADVIARAKVYVAALGDVSNLSRLTATEQSKLRELALAALDAYKAMGQEAPPALKAIVKELDAAAGAHRALEQAQKGSQGALIGMNLTMQQFANISRGFRADGTLIVQTLDQARQKALDTEAAFKKLFGTTAGLSLNLPSGQLPQNTELLNGARGAGEAAANAANQALLAGLASIPDTLARAFEGGGGIGGALSSIGAQLGKALGQAIASEIANSIQVALQDGKLVTTSGGLTGKSLGRASAAGGLTAGIALANGATTGQALGATASAAVGIGVTAAQAGASIASSVALGAATFGIGAAVIGAIALYKAKHQPEWKKLGADIGRDMGVQIPKELLKAWEQESKQFGRQATELLHLDQIIEQAGGVTAFGFDKATSAAHDLFSMLETGKISTQQVGAEFDKVFGQLAENVGPNGLASKGFVELIRLAERFGVSSKAVGEFLKGQVTGNIVPGVASFLAPSATAVEKRKTSQETLMSLQTQLTNTSDVKRQAELREEIAKTITEIQKQDQIINLTSVHSQAAATALAGSLAGSFGLLLKNGLSTTEAVKQVGPQVEELQKHLERTGFTGGAAFDALRKIVALASDEIAGPALDGVNGLGQALVGLSNTGLLTQETFTGFGGQAATTFEQLVAQGKDSNDVLRLMQPTLQTLFELQKKFGFATDEATQFLLDSAQAAGVVGDSFKSPQEQIIDGLHEISDVLAQAFGIDLPRHAKEGAEKAKNELDVIGRLHPEVIVGVHVKAPDVDAISGQVVDKFAGLRESLQTLPDGPEKALAMRDLENAMAAAASQGGADLRNCLEDVGSELTTLPTDARNAVRDINTELAKIKIPVIDITFKVDDVAFDVVRTDGGQSQTFTRGGFVKPQYFSGGGRVLPFPTAATVGDTIHASSHAHQHRAQHFATGAAMVSGPRGTDTVNAWLTPGEAVLPVPSVRALGPDRVRELIEIGRSGRVPQWFATTGGVVPQPSQYFADGGRVLPFLAGGIARVPSMLSATGGATTPQPSLPGRVGSSSWTLNATIVVPDGDTHSEERVLKHLENGLRKDTNFIRTKIEAIVEKKVQAA